VSDALAKVSKPTALTAFVRHAFDKGERGAHRARTAQAAENDVIVPRTGEGVYGGDAVLALHRSLCRPPTAERAGARVAESH